MARAPVNPSPPGQTPAPLEALGLLAAAIGLELLAVAVLPPDLGPSGGLWATAMLRTAELLLFALYWWSRYQRWPQLGLRGATAVKGALTGCLVALGLAATVGVLEIVLRVAGRGSFLAQIAGPAASGPTLVPLLLVGGLIGPLFEEVLFRGVVYAGLRQRLSIPLAVAATTILFAAAHLPTNAVPWVQAIGGVVFCAAYEIGKSLWAPLIVHIAGNLALFLLPLLPLG